MVSSIERFYCIQDSQLGPDGVLYREVHCRCVACEMWCCVNVLRCSGLLWEWHMEGGSVSVPVGDND